MDVLLFESLGIGAVLGLLLGLTGAGGSLVALPLLLSLHLPLRAIGVSLGAVALSALIGAIRARARARWPGGRCWSWRWPACRATPSANGSAASSRKAC